MAARRPTVIHAPSAEVTNWTSDRFKAHNLDALVLNLNTTLASGGTNGANVSLLGYDRNGSIYIIDQSANFLGTGKRAFCYGPGISAGGFRAVNCPIPYEFAFQVAFDYASYNFYAEIEETVVA